ncbi:hypothetical protein ACT5AM_002901 [Cronobacter malonaticus]
MSEISEVVKQKAAEMEAENDLVAIPRGLLGAALAVIKRPERSSANVVDLLSYYAYTKKAPGALRERAETEHVALEKCGCWYLVSWCYPGGRYGSTEIRLDGPWSKGSMRSAAKMIADCNDLVRANVVILSVFPIAAPQSTN